MQFQKNPSKKFLKKTLEEFRKPLKKNLREFLEIHGATLGGNHRRFPKGILGEIHREISKAICKGISGIISKGFPERIS